MFGCFKSDCSKNVWVDCLLLFPVSTYGPQVILVCGNPTYMHRLQTKQTENEKQKPANSFSKPEVC